VPRVLLASSSAVYGLGERDPSQTAAEPAAMSETTPCTPLNAYGESKLRMETAADAYRDAIADICCLRIGNVVGADALLLNARVQRKPAPAQIVATRPLTIHCFGTPSQDAAFCGPLRSYIGPRKLADVLHGLACHNGPLPARLNIAAPRTVHMDALAQAAGLSWEQRSAPQGAVQAVKLDCSKLALLLDDMFKANDSTPEQMIAEWKEVADDPA
jgi:nucleoside-diphosphate-sugar epimerase